MNSSEKKFASAVLVASSIAVALFVPGRSQAQGKDLREFSPPSSAGAHAVGPEDLAKVQANASNRQEPAWRSGIIDSGLAPFPAAMYQFENQWQEIVDGAHLKVYAGSLGKDRSQGIVVLQRISLDNRAEPPQEIRGPAGAGPLRIVAADKDLLTLKSSNGSEFTLNVATATLTLK